MVCQYNVISVTVTCQSWWCVSTGHQCQCHPSVLAVSPCPDPATEVGPEGGREFLPLFCGLLVLLGAVSLGVKPVISGSV